MFTQKKKKADVTFIITRSEFAVKPMKFQLQGLCLAQTLVM